MENTEIQDFVCVLLIGLMMLVMVVSLLFSMPCQGPYIIKFEWSGQMPTTFKESGHLPIETEKNNDWDWDNNGKKKSEKESDKKDKVVPAPAYLFCPPSI